MPEQGHKNRKVGVVVSTKSAKTIVVEVSRRVEHPLYRRYITRKKKFMAHDELETAKMGDRVCIVECRPLSKRKRWRLEEVVLKAPQVEIKVRRQRREAAGR
ncbi:MAG: 30S ribosomal protein S17 [Acidobacteriia bacterium]|nr:30S ribosomal protein S17 [Terriglobia bacterium]MYG03604.1 30S ribosomal protein S17 [Terriglobia bacterium]MYK10641.1 30S ribosomal protein S17 [Terriglobia bacterium]